MQLAGALSKLQRPPQRLLLLERELPRVWPPQPGARHYLSENSSMAMRMRARTQRPSGLPLWQQHCVRYWHNWQTTCDTSTRLVSGMLGSSCNNGGITMMLQGPFATRFALIDYRFKIIWNRL